MNWSRYNYLFISEKFGYLIYNSRTNSFAEMDKNLYDILLKIKKEPDKFDFKNYPELNRQLKEAKILVDKSEDLDFFYEKKLEYYKAAFNNDILNLTIAPTLGCNFNCFYCYEGEHKTVLMNEDTEKKIIEFIKSFSEAKKIKLTWYGGEPLLGFKTIVRLTDKIQQLKKTLEIQIVTNAYILDEEKSKYFSKIGLKDIQVTIDGVEETHNIRRTQKNGKPTYNKILRNIDTFLKYNKKTRVYIRVNIDKDNRDEFHKVYFNLKKRWENDNVVIYAAFIRDHTSKCKCNINNSVEEANFFIEQSVEYGVKNLNFYPHLTLGGCGANSINFFVIGPTGELYQCWNDIGIPEKKIGQLGDEFCRRIIARYVVGPSIFEEEECKKCLMFPICSGGCSFKRIQNKFEDKKNNVCSYGKLSLDKFLELHYEKKKMAGKEN